MPKILHTEIGVGRKNDGNVGGCWSTCWSIVGTNSVTIHLHVKTYTFKGLLTVHQRLEVFGVVPCWSIVGIQFWEIMDILK